MSGHAGRAPAAGGPAAGGEAIARDAGSETVRFFQALGDGTRLELLELLRDGERTVGELVDALGCPQPKVSRHLKVLREAGLVHDRREGRNVTYALATRKAWPAPVRAWLERLDAGMLPEEMMPAKRGRAEGAGAGHAGAGAAGAAPAGAAKPGRPGTSGRPARPARPPRDLEPWLL